MIGLEETQERTLVAHIYLGNLTFKLFSPPTDKLRVYDRNYPILDVEPEQVADLRKLIQQEGRSCDSVCYTGSLEGHVKTFAKRQAEQAVRNKKSFLGFDFLHNKLVYIPHSS